MSERVVGWLCDQEWIETYNKIYYGSVEDQYDALAIMNVWRARFGGRIPVAIDATSRLLEAWIEAKNISNDAKRQLLSASVTQFVGLITEHSLKGNTRKPIHEIGEDLGIPEWLVNLRHEMAHGPLPSLSMLEKAVSFGLDWLKDRHWDVHHEVAMQNIQMKASVEDISEINSDLNLLVMDYVKAMNQNKEGGSLKKKKLRLNTIFKNIDSFLQTEIHLKQLCHVLVEHGYLAGVPKRLIPNLTKDRKIKGKYFKFWSALIDYITSRNLHYYFFFVLCQSFNNVDQTSATAFKLWKKYILNELQNNNHVPVEETELNYWRKSFALLLCNLEDRPCGVEITNQIEAAFPSLSCDAGVLKIKELHKVLNSPKDTGQPWEKTFIVEDIKQIASKQTKTPIAADASTWQLYEGQLDGTPIGLMPWQTIQPLEESNYQEYLLQESYTSTGVVENMEDSGANEIGEMQLSVSPKGLSKLSENHWASLKLSLSNI